MMDQKHIAVWDNCLRIIKDNIPPSSFKTWFAPIKAVKFLDSVLTIEVPSDFFREYLEEQFIELIGKTLRRVVGSSAKLEYNVRVVSNEDAVTMPQQGVHEITNKTVPFPAQTGTFANPFVIPGLQQRQIDPQLNPNFNFRNFVEGECNRLARAAGLNISSSPGNNSFNPLFLYGGSGLGKTHLAQAIGIDIKEKFPDKIVLY
ncbi:MAG: DnaA/Hda family protein, partial [Bacteroidales bacterium]|nr:DnaA/Hda family protein [Bacteroidales bacterium]